MSTQARLFFGIAGAYLKRALCLFYLGGCIWGLQRRQIRFTKRTLEMHVHLAFIYVDPNKAILLHGRKIDRVRNSAL